MAVQRNERCIFCKAPTEDSKSEEHIIPESLGNRSHVLDPGIVCDKCNNYFALKVEKPVLDSPRFRVLRGLQEIPNKRKRFPSVPGMTSTGIKIEMHRERKSGEPHLAVPVGDYDRLIDHMQKTGSGTLYLPTDAEPPQATVFSRFLAKIAVEAMAKRLLEQDVSRLPEFVADWQLDDIRGHARQGTPRNWPFSERRIYSADADVIHEFDFLITPEKEMYFVLALFGIEYAINVGGPCLDGYDRWRGNNGDSSPLYAGQNSNAPAPRIAT